MVNIMGADVLAPQGGNLFNNDNDIHAVTSVFILTIGLNIGFIHVHGIYNIHLIVTWWHNLSCFFFTFALTMTR